MAMMYRIVHHLIAIPSQPQEQQNAMPNHLHRYRSPEYKAINTHTHTAVLISMLTLEAYNVELGRVQAITS